MYSHDSVFISFRLDEVRRWLCGLKRWRQDHYAVITVVKISIKCEQYSRPRETGVRISE